MTIDIHSLNYWYPRHDEPALRDVTLSIGAGDFALVAGPSGGGKSTLLRLLNGLVPQFYGGRLAGDVRVAGVDPTRTPARTMATMVGLVFQEPEAQAVVDIVEDEIAFGMEQQGVPPPEMRRRLEALLDQLDIAHLRARRITTLSGGERQRVAIAAVLALEPRILAMDEPTSQLDPDGAAQVAAALLAARQARDLTIVLSEHRLERFLPLATTLVNVIDGAVTAGMPDETAVSLHTLPAVVELALTAGLRPIPLSVATAQAAFAAAGVRFDLRPPSPLPPIGNELLRADSVTVRYGAHTALADASFTLHEGEVIALVGPNGSGKSTLFRAISGLSMPAGGTLHFRGSEAPATVQQRTAFAALVPQDPAIALYHDTVAEELADTLDARASARPLATALTDWNVAGLSGRNPRDISVGQQQRVAIGAMLAHEPPVWLMDEPTRGADEHAKRWLAARLRRHAAAGGAAIVATHDIETAARFATRVIRLDGGRITFDLPVEQALGSAGPLPTQAAQLVPGALTTDDVTLAPRRAPVGVAP